MFFASLPYTHAPSPRLRHGARGKHADEAAPLPFAGFVRLVLGATGAVASPHF